MAFAPRYLLGLILLAPIPVHLLASGPRPQVSRTWIAGQEAGSMIESRSADADGILIESRESEHLERMGTVIQIECQERDRKRPDGSMSFTWTLSMSQEPQEGEGSWSPREPGKLKLTFKDGSPRTVEIPAGACIWPGDVDDGLKAAARSTSPARIHYFAFPTQQWGELDIKPLGAAPLPGFPDTVRFRGRSWEGSMVEDVELWISPSQGEVKRISAIAGIPMLSQRAELPPPAGPAPSAGLFERTVKALPPHPFLLWLPSVKVRWTGTSVPDLGEDPQQRRLEPRLYRLARAQPPTPAEAAELPVKGRPSPEDAPFLAATPLVQFNDPVFKGLERRLNPPRHATRWELAQLVTSFVFEWIKDKNYTVGFASAQEVARNPEGACAQHGVLAVALLRRLGVPARGVTGWIALGPNLALHFWVEAELGGRWIPLDPTFDQAPASAYRLKLGSSDLADLGNVGTATPGIDYLEGAWAPDGPWTADVRPQGDTLMAPDGIALKVPGARWTFSEGQADLVWDGRHRVEAVPHPAPALRVDAQRLQGTSSRRTGWFQPRTGQLWMDLGTGRWLQVDGLTETQAFKLLDEMEAETWNRADGGSERAAWEPFFLVIPSTPAPA